LIHGQRVRYPHSREEAQPMHRKHLLEPFVQVADRKLVDYRQVLADLQQGRLFLGIRLMLVDGAWILRR
jgi:hypothetical protein